MTTGGMFIPNRVSISKRNWTWFLFLGKYMYIFITCIYIFIHRWRYVNCTHKIILSIWFYIGTHNSKVPLVLPCFFWTCGIEILSDSDRQRNDQKIRGILSCLSCKYHSILVFQTPPIIPDTCGLEVFVLNHFFSTAHVHLFFALLEEMSSPNKKWSTSQSAPSSIIQQNTNGPLFPGSQRPSQKK